MDRRRCRDQCAGPPGRAGVSRPEACMDRSRTPGLTERGRLLAVEDPQRLNGMRLPVRPPLRLQEDRDSFTWRNRGRRAGTARGTGGHQPHRTCRVSGLNGPSHRQRPQARISRHVWSTVRHFIGKGFEGIIGDPKSRKSADHGGGVPVSKRRVCDLIRDDESTEPNPNAMTSFRGAHQRSSNSRAMPRRIHT